MLINKSKNVFLKSNFLIKFIDDFQINVEEK